MSLTGVDPDAAGVEVNAVVVAAGVGGMASIVTGVEQLHGSTEELAVGEPETLRRSIAARGHDEPGSSEQMGFSRG